MKENTERLKAKLEQAQVAQPNMLNPQEVVNPEAGRVEFERAEKLRKQLDEMQENYQQQLNRMMDEHESEKTKLALQHADEVEKLRSEQVQRP